MAEALARAKFGNLLRVLSAGIHPQKAEDAQCAINTLKLDFNIDASAHIPRDIRTLDLTEFDQIIAMDKHIAMELRKLTDREISLWKIQDPWGSNEYRECALKILRQLNRLELK